MGEREAKGKMDYWFNLGVAVAALVVVGVLMSRGLAGADRLFTAYMVALSVANGALWATAQAGITERNYGWTYVVLNLALLSLVAVLAWRALPLPGYILIACAGILAAGFVGGFNRGRDLWWLLHGQLGAQLVIYALGMWAASYAATSDFQWAKLNGLALYWAAQGVTWLCVWGAAGKPGTVKTLSDFSGLLGAIACLWMAVNFGGMDVEGKRAPVDENHDAPPAMEAVYREKVKP